MLTIELQLLYSFQSLNEGGIFHDDLASRNMVIKDLKIDVSYNQIQGLSILTY